MSAPRWEHFGLIQTFVRGRWIDPHVTMYGPKALEAQRFALRRLYDLRLGVDYRLDPVDQQAGEHVTRGAQCRVRYSNSSSHFLPFAWGGLSSKTGSCDNYPLRTEINRKELRP